MSHITSISDQKRPPTRNAVVDGNQALCTSGMSGGAGGGVNAVFDEGPATMTIEDSIISNNIAGDHGAAAAGDQVTVHLTNVLITGNTATSGAGNAFAFNSSNVTVVNSTLSDNSGDVGVVMWAGGHLTLTNSILWNNALNLLADDPPCPTCFTVTYSNIEGGWAGAGNINAEPQFVDAANGDYRLGIGSPCIDRGTSVGAPLYDIVGTLRSAAPDMGAYEWTGHRIYLPLTLGTE